MVGYTLSFILLLNFNCVQVSFYILILKSCLSALFAKKKIKILWVHGRTDIKIYIGAIEKMFKKMKHKKLHCNCILKLFLKLLFFVNLQRKREAEGTGQ